MHRIFIILPLLFSVVQSFRFHRPIALDDRPSLSSSPENPPSFCHVDTPFDVDFNGTKMRGTIETRCFPSAIDNIAGEVNGTFDHRYFVNTALTTASSGNRSTAAQHFDYAFLCMYYNYSFDY